MGEQEIKELHEAISKLSEEDQAQIAGGNKISDEQCAKLQRMLENPVLEKYGGPMPKIDLPEPKRVDIDYGGPIPKIDLSKLKKTSEEGFDNSAT